MTDEKRAPVQGYSAGIPWSMHLRAYDAYCAKYSPQPALIDLEGRGCRGGFGVKELDMFIPGWREELSEIAALKARIAELEAASPPPPTLPDLEGVKEALRRIEQWRGEFPPTGRFYPDGSEMSYGAAFGSNGERDYMRSVARAALQALEAKDV